MHHAISKEVRILLIDDEPAQLDVLGDILTLHGCDPQRIRSATDPRAAAALFEECQPDLVLLDLVMPGGGGLQVLRELRALIPAGTYLPILVVTADPAIESRRQALASGATDFIAKPWDASEIILRVGNLLATRSLHLQTVRQNRELTAEVRQRREAEEALQRERDDWRDFFENAPIALQRIGEDGTILWANQAQMEMGGYAREEYIGRSITEFHADTPVSDDIFTRLLNKETLRNHEARLLCKDGSIRHMLINSNVLWREGKFVHTHCFTRDVTERKQAEDALRASEARYQRIAANSPGMVYQFLRRPDGSMSFPYVSEGSRQLFGLEPAEIEADASLLLSHIHPADLPEFVRSVEASATRRSDWNWEGRFARAAGQEIWVQGASRPELQPDGAILWDGLLMDITERKEAQTQLDRFFALSLDMLTTAGTDGYFKRVNPAWEATLGWTREELLGTPFIEFVHPEDRAATLAEVQRLFAGGETFSFQNRYRCKDGSHRYFAWTARRDVEKKLLHATARDITRRKQDEAALRESKLQLAASAERTRLILANAHDAFVGMDAEGRITDWNPQAEATFGWSQEEAMGKSLDELIVPERFREMHEHGRGHFLTAGDGSLFNRRLEQAALHREGHEFPVELTVSPVPFGDSVMFSAFLRDVSERNRAEENLRAAKQEAERANLAKSEFLSRMSHELRTPLNAILGFGQLLEMDDLEARQHEGVGHILKAGRHLLSLINEVLDISGIEAGQLTLSLEPVQVREAWQEMLSLVRAAAAARHVTLPEFTSDHRVFADPQRLKQVLLNLLSNAVKYNREGGSVTVTAATTGHGTLRLAVRDTGAGIAPGDLSKVFVSFERLGAAELRIEGTGLGLPISKRLVEAMGGAIGVESVLGAGSTFWIELPLVGNR